MSEQSAATAPPKQRPGMSPRARWVSASALATLLLASLDQNVVGSAAWPIAQDLDPQRGLQLLPWLFTVYILASTATQPLYGKLSDIYGPKAVFVFSTSLFVAGSALCGLSQNMIELIVFRAVQGIGAGGLVGVTLVIIAVISPPRTRAKRSGLGGAVIGGGTIAGPLLGGFIADHATWRWLFYINLPLGIAALIIMLIAFQMPKQQRREPVDIGGAVLIALATSVILLITDWGGNRYSWSSPTIIGLAVVGVVTFAVFVWQERRTPAPILPFSLFRNPVYRIVSPLQFLTGLSIMSAPVYLGTYLQIGRSQTPSHSALFTVPLAAGLIVMSTFGGIWISRFGRYRMILLVGNVLCTVALFMLGVLNSSTPVWYIALDLLLLGAGLGSLIQVTTLAVQNAMPPSQLGVATISVRFSNRIGQAFGTAILGALLNTLFLAQLPAQYTNTVAHGAVDIGQIHELSAQAQHVVREAFVTASNQLYLIAAALSLVTVVLSIFVRETIQDAEAAGVGEPDPVLAPAAAADSPADDTGPGLSARS
ncbi:MFS transporter [Dactylosporangium sp. CA-092794]|uniref:MFS transporter n=1 Tax=Dactylosporangium sp. CA-092794 TaxID=3239929 RepID=UPI003D8E461C